MTIDFSAPIFLRRLPNLPTAPRDACAADRAGRGQDLLRRGGRRWRRGAGHREAEGERALLRVHLGVSEESFKSRGSHHGCRAEDWHGDSPSVTWVPDGEGHVMVYVTR